MNDGLITLTEAEERLDRKTSGLFGKHWKKYHIKVGKSLRFDWARYVRNGMPTPPVAIDRIATPKGCMLIKDAAEKLNISSKTLYSGRYDEWIFKKEGGKFMRVDAFIEAGCPMVKKGRPYGSTTKKAKKEEIKINPYFLRRGI